MSEFFLWLIGFVMGISFMAHLAIYSNNTVQKDEDRLVEFHEICAEANSVPLEYDFAGELVCANGATFDYKD